MTDTTPPDGGRITDLLLEREMRESYLNYSMSAVSYTHLTLPTIE